MKKIQLSLATIGYSLCSSLRPYDGFLLCTETSTGNLLQAGELDLEIDNQSYYNGVLNAPTTWTLEQWANQLFFNFLDIKPDDYGEDTISLHAENDYWLYMQMQVSDKI